MDLCLLFLNVISTTERYEHAGILYPVVCAAFDLTF